MQSIGQGPHVSGRIDCRWQRAARETTCRPGRAPQIVQHGTNGETFIKLDKDAQEHCGLKIATLEAIEAKPEIKAFGRVLDPSLLATQLVDINTAKVVSSIVLEVNSRPQSILVAQGLGIAIVTEPSTSSQGKVVLLGLNPPAALGTFNVNPDNSGGSSDIAIFGNTVFFANQSGGTITIAPVPLGAFTPTTLSIGMGVRGLAVDTKDKLLLVGNQGSGVIALVDLNTGQIVGRINAVVSENEDDDNGKTKHDNRDDRDKAGNAPAISSVTPDKSKPGTTMTLTIAGKNLTGATDVMFVDPDSLPGKGKGRGNGNSGNHNHGPFGTRDPGFVVSNIGVIFIDRGVAASRIGNRHVSNAALKGKSKAVNIASIAREFTCVSRRAPRRARLDVRGGEPHR